MSWTTPGLVRSWLLQQPGAQDPDPDTLTLVLDAVDSLVDRYAGGTTETTPGERGVSWADARLAATMLAARLTRRRTSPEGAIAAGWDAGQVAYVATQDPDISRLLRIGTSLRPSAI